MEKRFIIGAIGILLCISGFAITTVQAAPNSSYIVYGTILKSGHGLNSATVTVTNVNTSEHIATTSDTDAFGNPGTYQVNLGNLASGWERGNVIDVFAQSSNWQKHVTFNISANGTMYMINATLVSTGGGGGERGSGHLIPGFEIATLGIALVVTMAIIMTSRKKKDQ